jgi:hypothetical protein
MSFCVLEKYDYLELDKIYGALKFRIFAVFEVTARALTTLVKTLCFCH